MYELKPMTERVIRVRNRYRTETPKLSIARLRLITGFYKSHPELVGTLLRAENLKNLCERMPIYVGEDDIIVGGQTEYFRGSSMFPEFGGIAWFRNEWEEGILTDRVTDNYILDQSDIDYVLSTVEFWEGANNSSRMSQYIPEAYQKSIGNGVIMFNGKHICTMPIGHYCANYETAIHKGFKAIKEEALARMAEMEGRVFGKDFEKYTFYRSVSVCCDAVMIYAKRYGALCRELAGREQSPERKAELEAMAESLDHIIENPCRSYYEAMQCMYLYHMVMCLDGQNHGISFGRVDQYLGKFYDTDIEAGRITPEQAQEMLDMLYLKTALNCKMGPSTSQRGVSGYTSGMLMTLGGVDRDGNDATNAVTYMMLQSAGRLILHDPPQALRVHDNMPDELWEAAIRTTIVAGGVPTFEYDGIIIPNLIAGGLSEESARNYCLIGCVEPAGCGDHWSMSGGNAFEGYWNMANCYLQAVNNGHNPFPFADNDPGNQSGLATGYLYEMETFEEVLDAVVKQMEFFVNWQVTMTNLQEYMCARELPLPMVSATMTGCMESGRDVMDGGAQYNSTGFMGMGIGNLVDCLAVTKYMVYDKKLCTARELYDAFINDWSGKEALRQFVLNEVPRYGNGIDYADQFAAWVGEKFAGFVNAATGPRGRFFAALWPVAFNVTAGLTTAATPDGRKAGQALSDGISPMQQVDQNGPTSILRSVSFIDQTQYPDGTLLNMKIHPSSVSNEASRAKFRTLIEAFFAMGGMEMQFNIVNSEMLREAQKAPDEYKDLVVRVAGFSAYFVELHPCSQNEIISRTDLEVG
jgi:formate C-acetyltransferase